MLTDAPFVCNKKKLLTTSILLVIIQNGYGRRFSSDLNSIDCPATKLAPRTRRPYAMFLKKRASYTTGKGYFQMRYLVDVEGEM